MNVRESIDAATGRSLDEVGLQPFQIEPERRRRIPLAFGGALLLHALFLLSLALFGRFQMRSRDVEAQLHPRPTPVRVVFYQDPPKRKAEPPPLAQEFSDESRRARSEVAPTDPSTSRQPAATGTTAEHREEKRVVTNRDLERAGLRQPRAEAEAAPPSATPATLVPPARFGGSEPSSTLANTVLSPSLRPSSETAPQGDPFGAGALDNAIRREGFGNTASGVSDTGSLDFDAKDFDWGAYARKIYEIVDRNWKSVMPLAARTPGVSGKVKVRFRILRSGKVEAIELLEMSGRSVLDQASMASIEMSDPLPPLPAEFPRDEVGVTFAYYYNLSPEHGR